MFRVCIWLGMMHLVYSLNTTHLVFLHIPKAGGFSMVEELAFLSGSVFQQRFNNNTIITIKDNWSRFVHGRYIHSSAEPVVSPRFDPELRGSPPPEKLAYRVGPVLPYDQHAYCPLHRIFRHYAVTIGHFDFSMKDVIEGHGCQPPPKWECEMTPRVEWITVLRDPMDRFVSLFHYWKVRPFRKYTLPPNITMEEFIPFLIQHQLDNYSTRALAGATSTSRWKISRDAWLFLAMINLERFRFVGFTNDLTRHLHKTRDIPIAHDKMEALSISLIRQVQEMDSLDMQLFAFARTRLYKPLI